MKQIKSDGFQLLFLSFVMKTPKMCVKLFKSQTKK